MNEAKIDGPNGNGAATPSVYVRLQKRSQAESKRPGPTHEQAGVRSLSMRFLVLACITCGLWLLTQYVDADPRFRVHNIELRGDQYVARMEVEKVFGADHEISIYQIPLEQRRRELEQIPWVRSATLTRVLPDRVVISVEERKPLAFLWTRRGIELIDRDGVILETPPGVSWTFPVLRGVSDREKADMRRARMERYLMLTEELRLAEGRFPSEISEVDLTDPADIRAVIADASGALRLHLGDEKFRERYEIYRSHIAEWRQQFNEIHSIDLRYEGQAVIQSGVPVTVRVEQQPAAPSAPGSEASLPRQAQPAPAAPPTRTTL
ncbi:MAG: FtsQ-type POTRA domain-containing protein [Acidobacteria bacterium]|nr:FtsQ-type POTRA domain-containing protein [Acidobacteriota bacterium]